MTVSTSVVVGSAVQAAQNRKRGPSVLERLRADEEAAAQQAAVASARSSKRRKTSALEASEAAERGGGMVMKTGMVLARAQLAESASGIVAARDRQAALVGKGLYREAEKVAREQALGTLATKDMPKRKGSTLDKAQFKEAFTTWMRKSVHAKVRVTRDSNPHQAHVVSRRKAVP